MKCLITGADGYIGRHVVRCAVARGLDVTAFDLHHRAEEDCVQYVDGNMFDIDLYKRLGSPQTIIHLAWQDGFNHNALSHLQNLSGHYRFLKNMIDSGCQSIAVMGTMHEVGYHEGAITADTPCNPMSLYGIAKNALRQAVLTYADGKDVRVKWLRAFYILGDDARNKSIFSKILEMARNGQKTFPFTTGLNKYDFISIEELARQIVCAAMQNEISGIINICSGKSVALRDKVEAFIRERGLDIKPEYGVYPARKYDSPEI